MQKNIDNELSDIEIYQVFCSTMDTLLKEDPDVVYLDADLMAAMKTKNLWEKYPNQVFNTGIQEANMIGVAAGLYLAGCKPYVHTFAPFVARRALDQLYVSIGYAKKSIHIVGSDPGICATDNGGTHMSFEDIAIMRTIPNTCIADISDPYVFEFLLKYTKERSGITYLRTPRKELYNIYQKTEKFELGKGKILSEGKDLTIIASGIMVKTALEADEELKSLGIFVRVVDLITIKPIDQDLIIDSAKRTGAILTVENHSIFGGLGGAVCEIVAEHFPVPVFRIGIRDKFGQVGDNFYLRCIYGLNKENIVKQAVKLLKNKKYIIKK